VKRLLSAFAAAAVLVGAAGMAPASADDVLRIGVEGAYPPFSWKEPDGTLKGFDIDIAMALCDKMGRQCELVEQDWDGIIPALLAKKYDAIVASMSITEERKKRVDFTDKYYHEPAKFVAAKDAGLEATPEGLAGKSVGVQRGTIHQCYMEKMFPDTDLRLYGTQEEEGFLNTDAGKDFAFFGGDQYDLECHGEGAGIAVRKGEDDLREAFNKAIKEIRADGTYQAINAKYFDYDIYGEEPGT
jgi:ABC-type amino acid transport substrate-binding protein